MPFYQVVFIRSFYPIHKPKAQIIRHLVTDHTSLPKKLRYKNGSIYFKKYAQARNNPYTPTPLKPLRLSLHCNHCKPTSSFLALDCNLKKS